MNVQFTKSDGILSKIRMIFWPIYRHELKKFIPMSALMFCILFNLNILRILKDAVLIPEAGVEITSFTKVYIITPVAALFVIIYSKLVNFLSFQQIFNYLTLAFVSFFFIFAVFIYPNVELFHMNPALVEKLMIEYPRVKWFIAIAGYWSFVLFYVLSELWPNIIYTLLFWQFANEITSTEEARRFYTLFSLFGNSALVFVGLLMMNLASPNSFLKDFFIQTDDKVLLVQSTIILIVFFAIISSLLVRHILKNVLQHNVVNLSMKNSDKPKLGLVESFRYIFSSRYLWLMLICSASFGLSMNLVEAVWKDRIKELYPTVNSYAEFNAFFIFWTGIVIMIMTIIGNNMMRAYNWFVVAVVAPVVILITGTLFFLLVVFDNKIVSLVDSFILISPLAMAVSLGAVQNIISKGIKFSIWDTSTEMLYIPLDQELKTKGKAAVSLISSKVGKASSGFVQSILFTIFPYATFLSLAYPMMIVFILVCVAWVFAVGKLFNLYKKLI